MCCAYRLEWSNVNREDLYRLQLRNTRVDYQTFTIELTWYIDKENAPQLSDLHTIYQYRVIVNASLWINSRYSEFVVAYEISERFISTTTWPYRKKSCKSTSVVSTGIKPKEMLRIHMQRLTNLVRFSRNETMNSATQETKNMHRVTTLSNLQFVAAWGFSHLAHWRARQKL